MNQPNEQATYTQAAGGLQPPLPPQQPAPQPWQQPVYQTQYQTQPQYQTQYQPYPYPAYYSGQAPGFAIRQKDPRKTGALSALNKLALLMVAQTALSFLIQLGAVIVLNGMGIDLFQDNLALVLLSVGIAPVCTAGPPLLYMAAGKKDWNLHLRFERAGFAGCLLVILAGLGICLGANIPAAVVRMALEGAGAVEPDSVLGQGGGWVSFVVELLGIAVMVPMLEEFAFRGVILSGLNRYGTGFAIAASSLIFGMAHMSLSTVVFAVIAGAAMGTAYVLTGNLWVSVAIHALNNAIAVIESYSDLLFGPGHQELLSGITMLAALGVGAVALVLLIVLRKRLFPKREPIAPSEGQRPLDFGESAVTMLKSPVLWAILAMVLVETAMMFV